MKKILTACLLLSFLASCSTDTAPAVKPDIAPATQINLDVLTVTVVDQTLPPAGDSPYTSNNFKPTLVEAMREWAAQHLAAVGSTGQATLIIRNASLSSQALAYSKDIFTRPQASRYIGRAEVELQITGHEGNGQVTAQASRFETLPENPTAIEKQNAYTAVLNGLMHDLGRNFDKAVQEHIGDFVVTAPILNSPAR